MSQTSDLFEPDREGAVPAWQPHEQIVRHAGMPLESETEFFVAPPQDIGEVITADSTLRYGKQPISPLLRCVLSLVLGAALVLFVGGIVVMSDLKLDPSIILLGCLGGFVVAAIAFFTMGFKHVCTFVGAAGIARYTLKGDREQEPREELLIFEDASNLTTSQTRHYHNGIYTGTAYEFKWTDVDGACLLKLAGQYKSKTGNPKPKDPFHFARSAENAWNGFLVHRLQKELEEHGYVEFKVNKHDVVRVGQGFLEFCLGGKTERITREDIKNVSISQGTFHIDTHDARWFSSKGKFRFNYGAMANAQLFLYSLQTLLGYSFE
jgi:hypothetical protein